jgi:hypothetical protein
LNFFFIYFSYLLYAAAALRAAGERGALPLSRALTLLPFGRERKRKRNLFYKHLNNRSIVLYTCENDLSSGFKKEIEKPG